MRENPTVVGFQRDLANSLHNSGTLLRGTGKPAEAVAALEEARAMFQRLAAQNPTVTEFESSFAMSQMNIGTVLGDTNRTAEALVAHEQARAMFERLAPESDCHRVSEQPRKEPLQHRQYPLCYRQAGRGAGRLRAGAGDSGTAGSRKPHSHRVPERSGDEPLHVGGVLLTTGKPTEALVVFEQARPIFERLARDHPESPDFASHLGATLHNMAMLDLKPGRFSQARDRLCEAIDWQKKALAANPRNPMYSQFLTNHFRVLVMACGGMGDESGAAEARRELAKLEANDPRWVTVDQRLAAVLKGEAAKNNAERLALARRAYDTRRYAAAAKLWGDAVEADPKLADDRQAQHRYNVACAAVLAARGESEGEPAPTDEARAKLARAGERVAQCRVSNLDQAARVGQGPRARRREANACALEARP